MKVVFLGPPGAGKGTQAKLLAERKRIAHISTGEMLRAAVAAGSDLGKQVKDIIDSGKLVPDALMVALIQDRVKAVDCAEGYILDGFPRTVPQAEALAEMLKSNGVALDAVVYFEVSEADLLRRLEHRRGVEQRADDSVATQLERLRVYREQTAPLVDFYRAKGALTSVDAAGSVDEVYSKLDSALS